MNDGCYGHRNSGMVLNKLISTPYGGGGGAEGKNSFRDFDEQYILQSIIWKNLFHLK